MATAPRSSAPVGALLALVATTALWGTSFVATKAVLPAVPPITLATLRLAVALAALVPVTRRLGQTPDLGRGAALLGLTGIAFCFVCQNIGLRFASAATAALILNGGIPVLTVLLAAVVLRERIADQRLVGTVLAFAGVGLLVLLPLGGFSGAPVPGALLGNALLLTAAAAYAIYTLIGRRVFDIDAALRMTAGSMLYGALGLLPIAACELATTGMHWPDGRAVALILYLGLGCSALPFVLWGYALARLEAVQVAVISNLELLFGVAFAALLLGEPLSRSQLGGGGLILVGASLVALA
ncbi:MAG TPA: DMT family transporter [Thermomicrobiales bacterium]|nr:DMT family transporter [Thermomicrobiales bacterium]